jgi:ubiquinone/menaquinone biosynthesis methyltransferase
MGPSTVASSFAEPLVDTNTSFNSTTSINYNGTNDTNATRFGSITSNDYSSPSTQDSTHFGFTTVPTAEKEPRVQQVFASVADSYDVMNDLMSGGLHRYWKDYLVSMTRIESMAQWIRQRNNSTTSLRLLDVAGGTGDVAFRLCEAAGCKERSESSGTDCISVTICDLNADMLRVGQERARQRYPSHETTAMSRLEETQALRFVQGNAQELPFDDKSFDVYTIAFGLRNVTDVDQALREAHRVLKPGGRFLCLEFSSQLLNSYLQSIYDAYSFNVIPAMGEAIAHDRSSYQYLVESIRRFSTPDELIQRMQQAGLQSCQYTNMTGGIVAIHEGYKGLL